MEEGDDAFQWQELESAGESCDVWLDALRAGTKALMKYTSNERIGPRKNGDEAEENGAQVGIPLRN